MQNWILFSIITGICFGLQATLIKYLSNKLPQFSILAALFLIASIFLFPFAASDFKITDYLTFILAFFVTYSLNIVAFYLLVKAISSAPVSVIAPYLNLTPLFMVLSGYIILDEVLTGAKIFWIIIIIFGAIVVQYELFYKIELTRLKNTFLAFAVAFIWSITASFEKIAVNSSNVYTYGFLVHFFLGLTFLILFLFSKESLKVDSKVKTLAIFLVGLFTAIMAIFQYKAIILTFVADVIAFKRAGVIISSMAGYIFFKEKRILRTLIGAIIIIIAAYQLTT